MISDSELSNANELDPSTDEAGDLLIKHIQEFADSRIADSGEDVVLDIWRESIRVFGLMFGEKIEESSHKSSLIYATVCAVEESMIKLIEKNRLCEGRFKGHVVDHEGNTI